jgi:hypothetical protein
LRSSGAKQLSWQPEPTREARETRYTGKVPNVRWVLVAAALGGLSGCGSKPIEPEGGSCPAQTSAAFTGKCLPRSLGPVTDPSSPDFGKVACRMFVVAPAETGICACDLPNYRPLGSIDTANVRQDFSASGYCSSACCESLCFCELLQLSGDDLARCQAGIIDASLDVPGFCYVEPDVGVGDLSTVKDCKASERHNLRLTPNYVNYDVTIECQPTL